jgi:hypothetical protein
MSDDRAVIYTWRFRRGDEILEVKRSSAPDATCLTIEGPSGTRTRTMTSPTPEGLLTMQTAFEDKLFSDGWTFETFTPERRRKPRVTST